MAIDFSHYSYQAVDYLEKLVEFGTPADPKGLTPAAKKRFQPCAEYLTAELEKLDVPVKLSPELYVYAHLPATVKDAPTIVLMAHYDTALDYPSAGTKLLKHKNYQSGDLILPHNQVTIAAQDLADKQGQTILTGSGDHQPGMDDKCGVAAILDTFCFFAKQPDLARPEIKLVFNHNEEVGRGIEYLDYDYLSADYGYCVDAGEVGKLFVQNFNAKQAEIEITGVVEHPGYAYGKMINALTLARLLAQQLADKFLPPEKSRELQPYLALRQLSGTWTQAKLSFVLRAFEMEQIDQMEQAIKLSLEYLQQLYPGSGWQLDWQKHHQYRNAKQILEQYPELNQKAEQAYQAVGVEVIPDAVRGGFDGINMSFAGLPTSNLFSAAYNMHGLNEFSTVEELQLTVRMLAHLVHLWSE